MMRLATKKRKAVPNSSTQKGVLRMQIGRNVGGKIADITTPANQTHYHPTQASRPSAGTETKKLIDDHVNRANQGAAGNPSKGAPAALMVPQVCPRTVRSLDPTEPMAPVAARAASSGERGGPDGDASRASQKNAAADRAAARQQNPKGASAALMGTQFEPARQERHAVVSVAALMGMQHQPLRKKQLQQ